MPQVTRYLVSGGHSIQITDKIIFQILLSGSFWHEANTCNFQAPPPPPSYCLPFSPTLLANLTVYVFLPFLFPRICVVGSVLTSNRKTWNGRQVGELKFGNETQAGGSSSWISDQPCFYFLRLTTLLSNQVSAFLERRKPTFR